LTVVANAEHEKQHGDPAQLSGPSRIDGQSQSPHNQDFSSTYSRSLIPASTSNSDIPSTEAPPGKPIFGVSLEELLRRDGSAIPLVVYQCLQAIDLFGLEVEGIYRLSGSAIHITKLRMIFDNGKFVLVSWRLQVSKSRQILIKWISVIPSIFFMTSTALLDYSSSSSETSRILCLPKSFTEVLSKPLVSLPRTVQTQC
jgi:hypothetical protein